MLSAGEVAARLDRATKPRRLLDHPFYVAWAEGKLTVEDLGFYSHQYWRQVEAFPTYLERLAARLPRGDARSIVTSNLGDERDDDHPGLWLRFAETLGSRPDDVVSSRPEPETEACVASFERATQDASLPYALGMLFGYESQTPKVAATKVAGLRDFYGIDGDGVAYFELHGKLDVEHAAGLARAIAEVAAGDGDLADAEAGARAGAGAVWGLLDGVARARGIAC